MFRLSPVVEAEYHSSPFEWAQSKSTEAFIELNDHSPDGDIAWIVALLASYNGILSSGSIEKATHAVMTADALVLPGGLMVRAENIEIPPSCCCGLEDWREWFSVEPGSISPWLGHDPSPWVECKPDLAVIWADSNLGDKSPCVPVSYSDLEAGRQSARTDLIAFTARLSSWLSRHAPQNTNMSQRFSEVFDVY